MAVTFFQCLHYLNKRFDLLAKAWTVLAAFLEGLLELEQKLSLCRQVGDGVSMAWCVCVLPPPLLIPLTRFQGDRAPHRDRVW